MKSKGECSKISACSLGVAFGVVEGLFMLGFALAGMFFGYGTSMSHQIASVYYGYAPTLKGGIYGAIWGFIDGFVFGLIAGWVYNKSLDYCKKYCK